MLVRLPPSAQKEADYATASNDLRRFYARWLVPKLVKNGHNPHQRIWGQSRAYSKPLIFNPPPSTPHNKQLVETQSKPHPSTILDASQRLSMSRKVASTWIMVFQALHRLLTIHIQAPFPRLSLIGSLSGFMILLANKLHYWLKTGM